MASDNAGGQIARNFRPGQIAEGLAIELFRPFMAVARVDQEEDFGIDFIGTLLKQSSRTYSAEQSCMFQVKISSAARFHIKGIGVNWLRQLVIPYFPVVIDRDTSTAHVYTLNHWHRVIHLSMVDEYIFVLDDDMENDPGDSFFSLGDPLMSWSIDDSRHPDFCIWAYSVMKPAIEIETRNQRLASIGRFEEIEGRNFIFGNRDVGNTAINPPRSGTIDYQYAGNHDLVKSHIRECMVPFVATVANTIFSRNMTNEVQKLVSIFSELGIETDRPDHLASYIEDMQA
ncbi:hypothetical protein PVT67_17450 [Gallaecimonas kandeliae]|uniref:hypothetical protein n=1 Tax=Gallaecimonas kandeliae TaxID=3029055 RepID=UPI0026478E95|nr:hypothetical protein [Gallaecimonas kandeliae]WKE65429.1 hypothetical protein PVT67_17450 [Gallaecimonas kandeliae]